MRVLERGARLACLGLVAILVSGCADPTTSDEYRQLAEDMSDIESELAESRTELDVKTQELAESESSIASLLEELSALESELTAAKEESEVVRSELEALQKVLGLSIAARIDGRQVTLSEVVALMDFDSAVSAEMLAQFLGFLVQWRIVESAAEAEFGIVIDESDIAAEAERIYETGNQGESRAEFLSRQNVTEAFLREIARQGLIDTAVREALSGDVPVPSQTEIDSEMEAAVANLTTVCVSHILLTTEDEAKDAYERVTGGGENFGEVAGELSIDPGSHADGGVLPCTTAGDYVIEFRNASLAAPIGEVHDEIVETQFGFHIIMVTSREDPSEDALPTEADVAKSIRDSAVGEVLEDWFFGAIAAADVVVDPEYGAWNPQPPNPGVVPPGS